MAAILDALRPAGVKELDIPEPWRRHVDAGLELIEFSNEKPRSAAAICTRNDAGQIHQACSIGGDNDGAGPDGRGERDIGAEIDIQAHQRVLNRIALAPPVHDHNFTAEPVRRQTPAKPEDTLFRPPDVTALP